MFENFIRIAAGVQIDSLVQALNKKPWLWDEITARQDTPGSPHSSTQSIFLRWCKSQTLSAVFNEIPAVEYPAFNELPEAWPILQEVLDLVKAKELGRILIVSLEPGCAIEPHVDEGAYADHFERFHVCLHSDLGNTFSVEKQPWCGEFVHMATGEVWWFNHKKHHAVFNGSRSPRIHMIIDAVAPLYRREREHALSA